MPIFCDPINSRTFKQPNLNLNSSQVTVSKSEFILTTYFQGLVVVSQVAFESNIADTKINKIDSHFTIDK